METIEIKVSVNAPNAVVSIDDTGGSTRQLQSPQRWLSVADRLPKSDDETVIVCTKDRAVYVSRTIGGRFLKDIAFWMPIPLPPSEQ